MDALSFILALCMPESAVSSATAAAASAAEAKELVDAVDVATVEETFSFLNIHP